jgi:acyl-CoA dehydrogenase
MMAREELALFRDPLPPEGSDTTVERERIRAFLARASAEGLFTPQVDSWLSSHSAEFTRALGAAGFIGMTWPARYGGRGATVAQRLAVIEELLAVGAPVAAHWFADRQIGPSLLRHGTEEQRRAFLPAIARGETFFCIGMSEPDSGSDLGSVRTAAVHVDGGWRVSGSKIWTSHADHAHHMLALVRTGAPGEPHRKALTQVIIDMSAPGVTVRPIRILDGREHFCEVFLEEVFVPESRVLGQLGAGWAQVLGELGFERSGPERFLSTFPLISGLVARGTDSDHVRVRAGELIARLVVLRAMTARVNSRLADPTAPAVAGAVVKDLGTAWELDSLSLADAWLDDHDDTGDLGQLHAEATAHSPAFTLRGGATEVMRDIIARAWEASR